MNAHDALAPRRAYNAPVRRRIAIILVFLLLGAVVNVAVAWAIALTSTLQVRTTADSFLGYSHGTLSSGHDWGLFANGTRGSLMILMFIEPADRANLVEEIRVRLELGEGSQYMQKPWAMSAVCIPEAGVDCAAGFAVAYGWPFLSHIAAFHEASYDEASPGFGKFKVVGFSAIVIGEPRALISPPLSLPVAPIYSGLVINAAFYALLLWLLLTTPLAARRMLRRRRGLCEKCAYPIGVSAVCTECGKPVPLKGVERT